MENMEFEKVLNSISCLQWWNSLSIHTTPVIKYPLFANKIFMQKWKSTFPILKET